MTEYIREPQRQIPVSGNYDVAVVGGGVAGIAAALSAARAGAKTVLLERQFALGGLATLGLVTIYLPLCDGCGHQVSFGIAEELLRLSVRLDDPPPAVLRWQEEKPTARFQCDFNPHQFAILAEKLLLEAGVEIFYGIQVCGASVTEGRIDAVLCESISGRTAIRAKSFVDASGDALLCQAAGEDTAEFARKNILAAWYYTAKGYHLHMLGVADLPEGERLAAPINHKRYTGLTCESQTEFMLDAHQALLEDFLKKGSFTPEHQLAGMATVPQFRMTRRLAGVTEVTEQTGPVPDSIGLISNWKRPGPVYEIPFSCLYGKKIRNLITAGRCISADDAMWDNTRVIPACAVTGEAAGLAAAMRQDFASLPVENLRNALKHRNIPLTLQDVL